MMGKRSRKIHNRGAQDVIAGLSLILVVFWFLSNPIGVRADVTWSGDINPADPTTWTSSTIGYIGKTGNGTMDITDGSDVINMTGIVGYESGSTGEVTVDGTGSMWTNGSHLYIGWYGSGKLTITSGGAVSNIYGCLGY